MVKNLSIVQKIYNRCNKTVSKRTIQKTAEATGDLIGNKIADKITSVLKKSSKDLHSQNEDELEKDKELVMN